MDFKQIIIVTGTPSVGKTTVSKQLAAKLGAFPLDLADLVKNERLTSGYDKQRQTLIADTDKLARRVHQIAKQQRKDVIIDGHYGTAVVPKDQITKVFVLRRHPEQLRQQMEKRGFTGSKLWENITVEILDVCLYDAIMDAGAEKVCEVDTTNKTVDDVVSEILSVLNEKKKCEVGIVDWLGRLEAEGNLDKYLEQF